MYEAKAMAENGARVLVLERERRFKDRVRGEGIWPWGVAELKELGVYQVLIDTCAREIQWLDTYLEGVRIEHRDLSGTSRQQTPALNWVHHEMEEAMLQAAENAGAQIRRGARAYDLKPGIPPSVAVEYEGRVDDLHSRLVVCADGRASLARKWANFPVRQDSYGMLLAGVLFDAMPAVSSDTNHWLMTPGLGQFAFLCPQGGGRMRAYAWHPREKNYRLQGTEDIARFVDESVKAGAPSEWYAGAHPIGPLATFDGADTWVEHPYKDGIALIGDAAAASDPSYGQGQSLTARDARVLRDQLLAHDNWDEAGHAYAREHDRCYAAVHKFTGWLYRIFYDIGPEADACRARALPLLAEDATRMPDTIVSGPEVPLDESVRRRFFGEA
jgi:menaquinone-9 beta-reductase